MARLNGYDGEIDCSLRSDERDQLPLKLRLKTLLAEKRSSGANDVNFGFSEKDDHCFSMPHLDIVVKKEDVHYDTQHIFTLNSLESAAKFSGNVVTSAQHPMLPKFLAEVKVEHGDGNTSSSGGSISSSACPDMQVKVKNEINDDVVDELDHIVLRERQRMVLSRKLLGLVTPILEGNSIQLPCPIIEDIIQQHTGAKSGESHLANEGLLASRDKLLGIPEKSASALCATVFGVADGDKTDTSCITQQCSPLSGSCQERELCRSRNHMVIQESDQRFSCKSIPSSRSSTSVKVEEPLDNNELHEPGKNVVGNLSFTELLPVKSELLIPNESIWDPVDHMPLQDRIKLMMSEEVSSNLDYSRKFVPSFLESRPIFSESAEPICNNRPRKRKKTATNSIETALEEDAPGLLRVLIDKGVSVDEIKLYGEMENDEALDDSFSENSISEFEDVISKLFFRQPSLLKFAPIRVSKGAKASYCLACLLSLVEQTRYLQFRKWPVQWGWCRDLQSFIFVFERHNRIVLERPEYGYATYFFELVDSLPINWQIKRLVIVMKLTTSSRVALIENKPLLVGEDLTDGEAKVLMEYGWTPNSGLASMLNYCDRVVHDLKKEDTFDWRAKIAKLLVYGYNGGTIVTTKIPERVMEYAGDQDPQIKVEL